MHLTIYQSAKSRVGKLLARGPHSEVEFFACCAVVFIKKSFHFESISGFLIFKPKTKQSLKKGLNFDSAPDFLIFILKNH